MFDREGGGGTGPSRGADGDRWDDGSVRDGDPIQVEVSRGTAGLLDPAGRQVDGRGAGNPSGAGGRVTGSGPSERRVGR
jgi:hypothetical protein